MWRAFAGFFPPQKEPPHITVPAIAKSRALANSITFLLGLGLYDSGRFFRLMGYSASISSSSCDSDISKLLASLSITSKHGSRWPFSKLLMCFIPIWARSDKSSCDHLRSFRSLDSLAPNNTRIMLFTHIECSVRVQHNRSYTTSGV